MVSFRHYRPSDAPALLALFKDTIRRVNSRDYAPDQIAAWASDEIDMVRWAGRFEGRCVVVAMEGDSPVGFAELEADVHIDRVYVSADRQGCGIGRHLMRLLFDEAERRGLVRLFVEASITARPFFEKQGFTAVAVQTVLCRGVGLLNYRMEWRKRERTWDPAQLDGILAFLRTAEQLKDTLRSAHTSGGRRESAAEHTWRLCLMAALLRHGLPEIDFSRLVRMCLIHDLGEAIGGDIPAVEQDATAPKTDRERRDFQSVIEPLPEKQRGELLELWDEYEAAQTPEARLAKGLDKLETILQHNQGRNPGDFDYAFNLEYGRRYTTGHPLLEAIRVRLDRDTAARVGGTNPPQSVTS